MKKDDLLIIDNKIIEKGCLLLNKTTTSTIGPFHLIINMTEWEKRQKFAEQYKPKKKWYEFWK